mmetsp:Transcript_42812/g.84433  ORF Transcript_42812/g.84433 Transcript_42812/m.84433 type:complete len:212 (+) Transcript_42812:279-914(+)
MGFALRDRNSLEELGGAADVYHHVLAPFHDRQDHPRPEEAFQSWGRSFIGTVEQQPRSRSLPDGQERKRLLCRVPPFVSVVDSPLSMVQLLFEVTPIPTRHGDGTQAFVGTRCNKMEVLLLETPYEHLSDGVDETKPRRRALLNYYQNAPRFHTIPEVFDQEVSAFLSLDRHERVRCNDQIKVRGHLEHPCLPADCRHIRCHKLSHSLEVL